MLSELCKCHNLLVFQEHWLWPANLGLTNSFHNDFSLTLLARF